MSHHFLSTPTTCLYCIMCSCHTVVRGTIESVGNVALDVKV